MDSVNDIIEIERIVEFNSFELNRIFTRKQIEALDRTRRAVSPDHVSAAMMYLPNTIAVDKRREGIHKALLQTEIEANAMKQFHEIRNDLMNKLECISMKFNCGIANDDVVYQSLHQLFIKFVKVVYFEIASNNQSAKDAYYTNIRKLYVKWVEKYKEENAKEDNLWHDVNNRQVNITNSIDMNT
jgi:hypothetical protein